MMKYFYFLLVVTALFFGGTDTQAQEIGEVGFDTTAASIGRMKLFGINNSLYYRSWTGGKYKLLIEADLDNHDHVIADIVGLSSALAGKEAVFTKNTGFNKPFGTTAGTVMQGNYVPTWASITGKPTTFTPSTHTHTFSSVTSKPTTISGYGITDFVSNWDARWNTARLYINSEEIFASSEVNSPKLVTNEIYLGDQLYTGNSEYGGKVGQVLQKKGNYPAPGAVEWDSLSFSNIRFGEKAVLVDTASGRAVFSLPSYVAVKIPDSSHFVIEPDYVKVWQVNTAFATVPIAYEIISVGLDSTELTLQKPNYDITYAIFCTCFDDTIIGYYDTIQYKVSIYNTFYSTANSSDSITLYRAQSILYFSDTIWFNNGDNYKFSNYISTDHSISQFRRSNQYLGAKIIWDNKQQKFFLQ